MVVVDMYETHIPYGLCILASFGVCGPVFGPIIGGFCGTSERMAVDHLDIHMALRLRVNHLIFPSSGNQCCRYPVPES